MHKPPAHDSGAHKTLNMIGPLTHKTSLASPAHRTGPADNSTTRLRRRTNSPPGPRDAQTSRWGPRRTSRWALRRPKLSPASHLRRTAPPSASPHQFRTNFNPLQYAWRSRSQHSIASIFKSIQFPHNRPIHENHCNHLLSIILDYTDIEAI